MSRVDVVGLGPAGEEFVTADALRRILAAEHPFLRTTQHPGAAVMAGVPSFDHLYETLDTFEEVYDAVVEHLLESARVHGDVLYAVPGSPAVAERTVELLRRRGPEREVEVKVHPALSFLDLAWARLGVDPLESAVHLVDGHRFGELRPADGGAVLVAQCESQFTMSDIKLSVDPGPTLDVVLLHHLGLPDEALISATWDDIDRAIEVDHLTSLWIPELPPTAGGRVDAFHDLMIRLRSDDAWKAAQDHDSLKRFLVEETYEVLEALDAYDPATGEGATHLAAELGDLLYQVVFHSVMAAETGAFELLDVVDAIHEKLLARDHTSADPGQDDVSVLVARWERAKLVEHARASTFDGIPDALPALLRALKVIRKAEAMGLSLPVGSEDGRPAIGDRLFRAAVDAAHSGCDPEDDLRRRLAQVETDLRRQEVDLRRIAGEP